MPAVVFVCPHNNQRSAGCIQAIRLDVPHSICSLPAAFPHLNLTQSFYRVLLLWVDEPAINKETDSLPTSMVTFFKSFFNDCNVMYIAKYDPGTTNAIGSQCWVSMMFADDLAPIGARSSAAIMMIQTSCSISGIPLPNVIHTYSCLFKACTIAFCIWTLTYLSHARGPFCKWYRNSK